MSPVTFTQDEVDALLRLIKFYGREAGHTTITSIDAARAKLEAATSARHRFVAQEDEVEPLFPVGPRVYFTFKGATWSCLSETLEVLLAKVEREEPFDLYAYDDCRAVKRAPKGVYPRPLTGRRPQERA